jgi:hypothetical protein
MAIIGLCRTASRLRFSITLVRVKRWQKRRWTDGIAARLDRLLDPALDQPAKKTCRFGNYQRWAVFLTHFGADRAARCVRKSRRDNDLRAVAVGPTHLNACPSGWGFLAEAIRVTDDLFTVVACGVRSAKRAGSNSRRSPT